MMEVDWNLLDFLEEPSLLLCLMNSWQFLCISYLRLILVKSLSRSLASLYMSEVLLLGRQQRNILRKLLMNSLIEKAFLVST